MHWSQGSGLGFQGGIEPEGGLSFGRKCPIHAGEFDLEMLGKLIPDPVI